MEAIIAKYKDYAKLNNWILIREETKDGYSIEWLTPTGNVVYIRDYYRKPGKLYLMGTSLN